MLYLIVGTVAESQPFTKRPISFRIDKGKRVALKLHGCVKRGQHHVHIAVHIDCRSKIGIDDTTYIAHQRHYRIYCRNKVQEFVDFEIVEHQSETKLHIPRRRCRIQCRQA